MRTGRGRTVDDRERAFTEYVEARAPAMLRTAMYLCAGAEAEAEDLLQSTLIRTYVAWHRVRDPGLRDAYVRRIMVRLSYRVKDARVHPAGLVVIPNGAGPDTDVAMDRLVDRDFLHSYLRSLPPRQRAVVVLRFYEDLSERQVAEALG